MKHIGLAQRIEIYSMLQLSKKQTEIAQSIGYQQSSISKEIKKGTRDGQYDPLYAHSLSKERRSKANIGRTKLLHGCLRSIIEEKLQSKDEDWSPDTIVGRMKAEGLQVVCEKTVYNFIHNHSPGIKEHLRHGRKGYRTRGKPEKRGIMHDIERIDKRPQEVELRNTTTHWEVDTIISGTRKGRLVTLVERKSRYIGIKKTSSGKALEVSEKIIDIGVQVGIENFETITSDNGKEFSDWEVVAHRLKAGFYFAGTYRSRERGTNENGNRCIRKHLPKGFEFETLTDNDIENLEKKLNMKPRKILNYRSPSEILFGEEITHFSQYSF